MKRQERPVHHLNHLSPRSVLHSFPVSSHSCSTRSPHAVLNLYCNLSLSVFILSHSRPVFPPRLFIFIYFPRASVQLSFPHHFGHHLSTFLHASSYLRRTHLVHLHIPILQHFFISFGLTSFSAPFGGEKKAKPLNKIVIFKYHQGLTLQYTYCILRNSPNYIYIFR